MNNETIIDRIKKAGDKKILKLDLSCCELEYIPDEVFDLTHLTVLTLGGRFNESNRIQELPTEISRLENLQVLDLRNNRLQKLPEEISQLKNLQRLDLSNNRLKQFPKKISDLKSLKYLNASWNQLEILPAEIFKLENLESLLASDNHIEVLPKEISKLKQLKTLDLSHNRLIGLPSEITQLNELQSAEFDRNDELKYPPLVIAVNGIGAIKNYFAELERGEKDYLDEIKLIIIGNAKVGKTSLANKIINLDSHLNESEPSTKGIADRPWIITKDKHRLPFDLRVNIWDFGGQEIYYATHQFFLTQRSFYLLVTESRNEYNHDEFYYWLGTIKSLGGKSPVIIVRNKSDQPSNALPISEYRSTFNNIKGYRETSCLDGNEKTIEELKTKIVEIITRENSIPHIGEIIPRAWKKIRNKLELLKQSGKNFIQYEEYLDICLKHNMDEERALYLSSYFHTLGIFLHFVNNLFLKDTIFLNNEWLTKSIYRIFDDITVKNKHGRFNEDDLNRIWSEQNYKAKQFQLLSLMSEEKFNLCFRLKEGEYLAPLLLPGDEISYDWRTHKNNLHFEYRYKRSNFMPKGILTTFIVKRNRDIYNEIYWRYGVLLEYENTRAIVKESCKDRKITITLEGPNKKGFLHILRHTFQEIHTNFHNLEVDERIPCNCNKCKKELNSEDIHFFEYATLRKYEQKGRKTIVCDKSVDEVLVRDLIDDVIANEEELGEDFLDQLRDDLIDIAIMLLERRGPKQKENLYNDSLTDLLRAKKYYTTDQTRSGSVNNDAGEIDIMIRKSKTGIPISIIETFRLNSCGEDNTTISEHIDKLIHDYDTAGHPRNFIIVYAEAKNFLKLWKNYINYMKNINNKKGVRAEYPQIYFEDTIDKYTKVTDVRVGLARHKREGREVEVYHIFIKMNAVDGP